MSYFAKLSALWHEILPDWIIRNLPWLAGFAVYLQTNWDWVKTLTAVWVLLQMGRFFQHRYRMEVRRRRWREDHPDRTMPAELE